MIDELCLSRKESRVLHFFKLLFAVLVGGLSGALLTLKVSLPVGVCFGVLAGLFCLFMWRVEQNKNKRY